MKRKIVIIIAVLVLIFIVYNFGVRILTAFKAGDRLTAAASRLHTLEVKNKELKAQLEEVSSADYIEKQARDKLGLAKEGEILVVIPEERIKQVLGLQKETTQEEKLPNWLGWIRLFF